MQRFVGTLIQMGCVHNALVATPDDEDYIRDILLIPADIEVAGRVLIPGAEFLFDGQGQFVGVGGGDDYYEFKRRGEVWE
jgi:hypothetical protein